MSNNSNDAWRNTILGIREYAEEQFDRLIVYLNSGALVLTVGFVRDIVEVTDSTNTTNLKISWILFTVSLLLILISHRTAISSMNLELNDETSKSDRWDRITVVINWVSLFCLIAGIAFFLFFVSNAI